MSNPLSSLAEEAQGAYEAGNFDAAIKKQIQLIDVATRRGRLRAQNHLALAMFLFESGAFQESLDWLQKAVAIWPTNPQLWENIGVLLLRLERWDEARIELERSVALGSKSLNVFDSLCHCYGRLKDSVATQRYGRRVLEAKNKAALAKGTIYPLPSQLPPGFDPKRKQSNIISYSLWGNNPRYIAPLLENLKILPHLFPAWTIRVYIDKSVPNDVMSQLKRNGADLVAKASQRDAPFYSRLLWRFEVANDSTVQRFLVRDADSLLTVKERIAVDAWLKSNAYFHMMRDFYTHTDLMLAGMWGGVGNILPDLQKVWRDYRSEFVQGRTADQRLLSDMVWPTVSQSCLIHDSIFTGCLGSVPFPPYGDLYPGHHIGQNSFIHFSRK